jgi:hypothetical protein
MRAFFTTIIALVGLLSLALQGCNHRSQELPTPLAARPAIAVEEARTWYQTTTSPPAAPSSSARTDSQRPQPPLQWAKALAVGQGAG